jgi:predicted transcriptional regulator
VSMAKDLTAVRIPGELIEELKKISATAGGFYSERTASWLIVQAVKEFVERQKTPQATKGKVEARK